MPLIFVNADMSKIPCHCRASMGTLIRPEPVLCHPIPKTVAPVHCAVLNWLKKPATRTSSKRSCTWPRHGQGWPTRWRRLMRSSTWLSRTQRRDRPRYSIAFMSRQATSVLAVVTVDDLTATPSRLEAIGLDVTIDRVAPQGGERRVESLPAAGESLNGDR